jgi:pimeloyl-ACP methyl ester carboxylesterase
MVSLRTVGTEVSALSAAALSLPLRLVIANERFDPSSPHPTPVVLVHGFLGDPTNFLLMRTWLGGSGIRNFASFAYPPRLDYQRLAVRLGREIETLCASTGVPEVDVVGHSLGGLVARYLIGMMPEVPIRRLVTLGAPYFATSLPPQERAIFAAHDPFIPLPHARYGPHPSDVAAGGGITVVPDCGHWGLLYHPHVLREVCTYLGGGAATIGVAPATLALEAS